MSMPKKIKSFVAQATSGGLMRGSQRALEFIPGSGVGGRHKRGPQSLTSGLYHGKSPYSVDESIKKMNDITKDMAKRQKKGGLPTIAVNMRLKPRPGGGSWSK